MEPKKLRIIIMSFCMNYVSPPSGSWDSHSKFSIHFEVRLPEGVIVGCEGVAPRSGSVLCTSEIPVDCVASYHA